MYLCWLPVLFLLYFPSPSCQSLLVCVANLGHPQIGCPACHPGCFASIKEPWNEDYQKTKTGYFIYHLLSLDLFRLHIAQGSRSHPWAQHAIMTSSSSSMYSQSHHWDFYLTRPLFTYLELLILYESAMQIQTLYLPLGTSLLSTSFLLFPITQAPKCHSFEYTKCYIYIF